MKLLTKPKKFDNNIVVIGAGSGGLISAYIAAAVKAKVTLIEKHKMGGDCLNTGCVPSKALIKSARIAYQMRHASSYGLTDTKPKVDFNKVMERVQSKIAKIEPHDSVERYQSLGVNVIQGEAKLVSPWHIEVNDQLVTAQHIIIATGANPRVPNIKGIDKIKHLTSENLWEIRKQPKRLLVLGGGPIGSEMAQAFARLGSQVTQLEKSDRLMPHEDSEVSEYVKQCFESEGIQVLCNHEAQEIIQHDAKKIMVAKNYKNGQTLEIEFDELLISIGRQANIENFGLAEIGVEVTDRGVKVDGFLRTNHAHIFAVGDVIGSYQFTHTAGHMAWYAAVNALFGQFKKFKVDYSVIPWSTFIDPEVAHVGLNEQRAKLENIAYEVTKYELSDLDRSIADNIDRGWVKILTPPNKDKILGVTIVGEHAGDLITEFIMAMKHGLGLNKILGTIHIYPTLAEGNKMAAGTWKKKHIPEKLLSYVKKFHTWRRG